jgi:hypothetical protein
MPIFKGTWKARVEQDFEVEADTREEAWTMVENLMSPSNVVELTDFDARMEEGSDDEG